MEPIKQNPQQSTPGQYGPRPMNRPERPRPLMSDFAPRRASPTGVPVRRPVPQVQSQPSSPATAPLLQHASLPQQEPAPHQPQRAPLSPMPFAAPQQQATPSQPQRPLNPVQTPAQHPSSVAAPSQAVPVPNHGSAAPDPSDLPASHAKQAKEHSHSSHAGLVGFVVFVVLTALFLLPLLPGKIFASFPGSSQSLSSGDQAIACTGDPTNVTTMQKYDSKHGFPVVYKFATTTTLTGSCNGKPQSATGGHASQFNPLGGVIDVATALVIAVAVGKVWALVRRDR